MEPSSYTPLQETAFWKTVIRHSVWRANRKIYKWNREQLTLNTPAANGEEQSHQIPSPSAEQSFRDLELQLAVNTLPPSERFVIEGIYVRQLTQRQLARAMHKSQAAVSKIHRAALAQIRELMMREVHASKDS